MRSLTAFSMIVAGLRPLGARAAVEPRSSRKRRASAWTVSDFDIEKLCGDLMGFCDSEEMGDMHAN